MAARRDLGLAATCLIALTDTGTEAKVEYKQQVAAQMIAEALRDLRLIRLSLTQE